ncbi:Aste57867_15779 [Aphanomyces stellatus]|uniref:Aste57867_15779 protein n=1 Tax=Aphanomyces stellatus TaxID=120398 RepID=A0A485L5S4_9STRA|nr:hypothetical protein As57867_015723 [Aphanomyces stellatus]VFT92567.1 Aste57867_15779 [Aphanomyces stellatus]
MVSFFFVATTAAVLLLFSPGAVSLDADCQADSDCAAYPGTACVPILRNSFSSEIVQSKCTLKSVCRGSSAGNCPSYNAPSAPGGELATQCVLVNTTRLRNIKCCGGTWTNSSGHARRLAGTAAPAAPIFTSNLVSPIDSSDCFQCYTDLHNPGNMYYAGQFACVPIVECMGHSAFPKACKTNLCTSGLGQLCNNHGTCYPTDIDDPKNSYGCACNIGYSGVQCEKVTSNLCLVDCGDGNTKGTCVDNKCKCNAGWTGFQCERCTTDAACGGLCNAVTGQCSCPLSTTDDLQVIANTCVDVSSLSASVVANSTCATINCGKNGFCTNGQCFCSQGCLGSVCTTCTDATCSNCLTGSKSTAASVAAVPWLVLALIGTALVH